MKRSSGKIKIIILSNLILLSVFIPLKTVWGQDMAELSMRARNCLYESWDFDCVSKNLAKVIGKRHTPAFAYSDYGWYLILVGRYDEGLKYIEQAAVKAPKDKQLIAWNAWAKLWNGDLGDANKWIEKSLKIDSGYGEAIHIKSLIASAEGKHEKAIRLAEQAAANDKNWRGVIPIVLSRAGRKAEAILAAEKIEQDLGVFDIMLLMEAYAVMGEKEKALDYLEKGYELRHPFMPWMKFWPGTEDLHSDPRFQAIEKNMKLPK